MFGNILTAIGSLLHLYVFWRACSVPFLRRHIKPKMFAGIGLVLWVFFVVGRVVGHGESGAVANALELLSITWLASLFLVCVCLAATELITGFGFLFRKYAPVWRGWALIAGVVLSTFAMIQGLRPPTVQSYEIHVADLPPELDGTVLVAMSDLHLGSLLGEKWMDDRVKQVHALRPDMIVLLGDIFEGHGRPQDELLACLNRLSAPLGVWAVPGNHESYGARRGVPSLGQHESIQMLENRWVEIKRGLILAGVEDITVAKRSGREKGVVERALADRPQGTTILLSHTPWQTETASEQGVALMLCGHTHGGQIWPLGYLVHTRYPLMEGSYDVGEMTVLVCRGTGTWGPRMRLWRPGEIMRVTLRTGKD